MSAEQNQKPNLRLVAKFVDGTSVLVFLLIQKREHYAVFANPTLAEQKEQRETAKNTAEK
jgi:hypothetical protein